MTQNDEFWMQKALLLADRAAAEDEVPVGAILVKDGKMIARASNKREQWNSPIGHAEIIVLQRASQKLGAWRLSGTTLYVTLEPCVMCAGALVQARVERVVFGAYDPKGGALKTLYQIGEDPRLNHRLEIRGSVLEAECAQKLKTFFKKKRLSI